MTLGSPPHQPPKGLQRIRTNASFVATWLDRVLILCFFLSNLANLILPASGNLCAAESSFVVGIDEAGRGPLAGPVVAAAVILNPKKIPEGLDDSKRLTAQRREELFDIITDTALACAVASISAPAIDASDILRAALEAMRRAVCGLAILPGHALIDGRDVAPGLPCPATALIKGDQRSVSIAAASILAKVTRDRMMAQTGRILSALRPGIPCRLCH